MENQQQIPVLKKDAQIQITIGSALVSELQNVLTHIVKDKDTTFFKDKILSGASLSEWEQSAVTITRLLQHLTSIAQEKGFIEYKDMTDLINL